MDNNKVWFVTGASKGLGLTLIQQLLTAGHRVAATSRTISALTNALGTTPSSEQFLPLEVNLTDEQSVQRGIDATIAQFGRIDVLVNNAGYGHFGTLEELSDTEARENFEVNVFGSLNVIRHTMPHMRKQNAGHIFNIASIGGYIGNFPGWGIYCATKFAVAGFTESLAAEAAQFGIHATVVYPGYFRTNFLSEGSMKTPEHPIAAYESARASQQQHQADIDGQQPGNPEKAMEILIQVAASQQPPLHLFLGQDAYDMAALKNETIRKDLENWKTQATATGFPA
jgi:NAD(P)-dependent dehydrogenase (short-subunit alcohol dehydrogenase family)